jgi:hypothetical protein
MLGNLHVRFGGGEWGNMTWVRQCALLLPYDERPTGTIPPATLYPAYLEVIEPGLRGSDRIQWYVMVHWIAEAGHSIVPVRKAVRGQLELPSNRSGYREERDGSGISHHLHDLAESITMNVGGPCGEGCSPPVKRMGVGAVIVLGARESRVQGEGRQLVGISTQNSRMLTGMKFP